MSKKDIYEPLEGIRCISQSKGHTVEFIEPIDTHLELCFIPVFSPGLYLPVAIPDIFVLRNTWH